jgi:CRP-like cAMP-binding protein
MLSPSLASVLGRERPGDECALAQQWEERMAPKAPINVANGLLAGLPAKDLARLRRHLEPVTLTHRLILSRPDAPIEHVYFPDRGMVSLVQTLSDGAQIEVGVTGKEGFVGVATLLGATTSPIEAMVQIPGSGLRMSAVALREQVELSKPLSARLHRYAYALQIQISQTAACNGRHVVQERLARWLLTARDRADSDDLPLNHEFLSMMLGTRRVGVTLALGTFKAAGLIRNTHGRVTILDRANLEDAACECYRSVKEQFRLLL